MQKRKQKTDQSECPGWVKILVVVSLVPPTPVLFLYSENVVAPVIYSSLVMLVIRAVFGIETDTAIEKIVSIVRRE